MHGPINIRCCFCVYIVELKTQIYLSLELLSMYSLNVPYSLHLCEYGDKVSGWKYGTVENKRPRVLYLANLVEETKSWRKAKLFLI